MPAPPGELLKVIVEGFEPTEAPLGATDLQSGAASRICVTIYTRRVLHPADNRPPSAVTRVRQVAHGILHSRRFVPTDSSGSYFEVWPGRLRQLLTQTLFEPLAELLSYPRCTLLLVGGLAGPWNQLPCKDFASNSQDGRI